MPPMLLQMQVYALQYHIIYLLETRHYYSLTLPEGLYATLHFFTEEFDDNQ